MIKILKDDNLLQNNEIKSHDYQTRALISISNKYNSEKKFQWIIYNDYRNVVKKIINNNENFINDEDIDKFIENNLNELSELNHDNSQSNNILDEDEGKKEISSDNDELNEEINLKDNENIENKNNIVKIEANIKIGNENEFDYNDKDLLSCFSEVSPINSMENENYELENIKQTFNDKSDTLDKNKKFNYKKKRKRNYNECMEESIKENSNIFSKHKKLKKK